MKNDSKTAQTATARMAQNIYNGFRFFLENFGFSENIGTIAFFIVKIF